MNPHSEDGVQPGAPSKATTTLDTPHLRLLPFSAGALLALRAADGRFEELFGVPAAEGFGEFMLGPEVSAAWLEQLRSAPPEKADPWTFGFAIVHRESNLVIGIAGFKGPADASGEVEIAYGILPAYQGRGYATEAARALVMFASGHDAVKLVRAHTLPAPNASTRVLAKCGFTYRGEVVDPEDGLVWRWERTARLD